MLITEPCSCSRHNFGSVEGAVDPTGYCTANENAAASLVKSQVQPVLLQFLPLNLLQRPLSQLKVQHVLLHVLQVTVLQQPLSKLDVQQVLLHGTSFVSGQDL